MSGPLLLLSEFPYLAMQSHPDIQLGFLSPSPTCGKPFAFSSKDPRSFSPLGGLFFGGLEPAQVFPPPPSAAAFPRRPPWFVAFRAATSAAVVEEFGNLGGSSIRENQLPQQGLLGGTKWGSVSGNAFLVIPKTTYNSESHSRMIQSSNRGLGILSFYWRQYLKLSGGCGPASSSLPCRCRCCRRRDHSRRPVGPTPPPVPLSKASPWPLLSPSPSPLHPSPPPPFCTAALWPACVPPMLLLPSTVGAGFMLETVLPCVCCCRSFWCRQSAAPPGRNAHCRRLVPVAR